MRKAAFVSLVAALLLLAFAAPSHAWGRGHTRVFVGVGFGPVWWGPYPYWWYPPYPPYVYGPPTVVVQEPPVYVQQQPAPGPAVPTPQAYWYYCASVKGYYPTVPSCSEQWIRVPPRPE